MATQRQRKDIVLETLTDSGSEARTTRPVLPRRSPRVSDGPRLKRLLLAADLGAVLAATALCLMIVPVDPTAGQPRWTGLAALPLVPALWIAALRSQSLYAARRVVSRTEEFRRIVHASAAATAVMALIAYAAGITASRSWVVLLPVLATAALSLEREFARRLFLRLRRSGRLSRTVVVVGANDEAIELNAKLEEDPSIGYRIAGFVTDRPLETVHPVLRDRVLGSVDQTAEIVAAVGAVGVVVASTSVTTHVSNRLARTLTEHGIHVELTSTLRDIVINRLTVAEIGQFPTIYVEPVQRRGWRAFAKRWFDVSLSIVVLLLTAPLLLVVAAAIKWSSAGPVLFRQIRIGKDGHLFELVKFRTMVTDAEQQLVDLRSANEASGPLFKMENDPRVTRVGRVLRRTSIDELPQLWNVLRNEMSLVGPRPALPSEAALWDAPLYDRLRVKPGITGMWQVNGRSQASFDQYTRLDLYYVDNWSLLTDLVVILKTIPVVLFGKGAY